MSPEQKRAISACVRRTMANLVAGCQESLREYLADEVDDLLPWKNYCPEIILTVSDYGLRNADDENPYPAVVGTTRCVDDEDLLAILEPLVRNLQKHIEHERTLTTIEPLHIVRKY